MLETSMLTMISVIPNSVSMPQKQAVLEEKYKLKETNIFISLRKIISKADNFTMSEQAVSRNSSAWQYRSFMEILTLGCNISLTAACQG